MVRVIFFTSLLLLNTKMLSNFNANNSARFQIFDRYNVLVIGNSGVGKSTLIRELLNADSIRDNITTSISSKPYIKDNLPIALYDTPGLEKENKQRNKVKQEVAAFIKKQKEWNKQPHEHIHEIWFCINYQTTRESDVDQKWIAELAKQIPVILVVTRALSKEKTELQRQLENNTNIRQIVQILVKKENTNIGAIKPFGLDNLITTTQQLFQETTQIAIQNAVNAKAQKANAWLRDGCAKVLSAQILTVTAMTMFSPYIPPKLTEAPVSLLQGYMFSNISKTFECKFKLSFIQNMVTTSLGIPINDAFGGLIENTANSSLSLSENHFKTIQDVLSYFISNLQQVSETLPFKEQLIEVLSNIGKCNIIANLPIVKGISALTITLTTALIAIAYIDTLKKYKAAEYQGEPLPDIEAELQEQIRLIYQQIKNIFFGRAGENWA